jgi:PhzF family phenazine biosynthesis protein
MNIEVQIINAFVYNNQGGNPAGVVLDADTLSWDQKLAIASKAGVSETSFVSQSSIADFKLDFFTPNRQIAHCGHATIATFSYLAQLNRIPDSHTSKETIDGRREIIMKGDLAFMEQKSPKYKEPVSEYPKILKSLGITSDNLLSSPISIVNTGNSFLMVPLRSNDILKNLRPNLKLIEEVSDELDLIGYYPFTLETFVSSHDASTRMFGPRYAIPEEAGTGMAAGPLASYLYDKLGTQKQHMLIEQGWCMSPSSPSIIEVDLEIYSGKIQRIMAGGKGIVSNRLNIEI